jgi:signal transduction histidine kinase
MLAQDTQDATLLIVDDTPENISVLFEFLSYHGFKILVAEDGEDALENVQTQHPDLILLDVMMPGMDGFETCLRLKADPLLKDIPVIFMTALTNTADKVKGFELGAVDYVTKPFQQEEVLARINTHLTIRRLQKALKNQNEELDAFAHTVAHDLKNPLNAIINLTGLFLEHCSPDKPPGLTWMKRLHVVEKTGKQAAGIINALLLLAGVSRQADVEVHNLNMARIVDKVLQSLAEQITISQASIELPATWPTAVGYKPWIEEIWTNYLTNGLKYGGQPPCLQLGADLQEKEGMVRFWVCDNGSGLTPEAQAQLFTPFTRLHKNRAEGHGLGLSIVQRIVEKLGGHAGVESFMDQGSIFYFTLPTAND